MQKVSCAEWGAHGRLTDQLEDGSYVTSPAASRGSPISVRHLPKIVSKKKGTLGSL